MKLNADFSRRAAMHGAELDWITSPIPGVDRRLLDRIGGEVARATSLVRYAPGSRFSSHVHSGGEEFYVLEGTFQDEHGDYPAGTYVRNPPQSEHSPGSQEGCILFVKLWQFDPDDRAGLRIGAPEVESQPLGGRPGVSAAPLYRDENEDVRLEYWQPNADISFDVPAGIELLVIEGSFEESGEMFSCQSWLRLPAGSRLDATAGPDGCRAWVKSGHLAKPPLAPVG